LFYVVDLVRNRETKEPFNTGADKMKGNALVIDKVTAEMMKRGMSVLGWLSHLVLAPPLIITEQEIDTFVGHLDEALAIADAACI
jgi:taurine--2-oxoglutarate transaminase